MVLVQSHDEDVVVYLKSELPGPYRPPMTLTCEFGDVPQNLANRNLAQEIAVAVQRDDIDDVCEILKEDPHAATTTDSAGNTLFHLLAMKGGASEALGVMLPLLLRHGWEVVDQKNFRGERAETVAAREAPGQLMATSLESRSLSASEAPRCEKPLMLIGDVSPKSWEYLVKDEQRRCFAGVLKQGVPEETCQEWFSAAVERASWEELPGVQRKVAWYVDEVCTDCPYKYGGLEYPAIVFPPWMKKIRETVCDLCGIPRTCYPNSCNVNLYRDHTDDVGFHSDDEVYFQSLTGDTCIVSFSLGSARGFCWRLQGTSRTLGSVVLGDGDVMTMEGLFQKHYKHAVPAADQPCGARVNFTFRWIRVKAHALDAAVAST